MPVGRALRYADTYRMRLMLWVSIFRELRGVTANDRSILRRSARAAPLRALRNLSRWQNPVLLDEATVDVRGLGRFRARERSDDLYHLLPSREPAIFAAIRRHLGPGDCFIDAGANIGIYSVLAGRMVGKDGQVLAVEMMPDTAAALREHLRINDIRHARVVEHALGERSGETVTASYVPGHFGRASIMPSSHAALRTVEVETRTLDELTAELPRIALIKMDLEGAELAALKGARQTLAKTQVLIFEQNRGIDRTTEFLEHFGFAVSDLDGNDRIAVRTA